MLRIVLVTMLLLLSFLTSVQAREITDMAGRRVTVPDTIRRVFSGSPPSTYMLYALDPSLLVGLNFAPRAEDKRFLRPEFTRLPVTGGIFGQSRSINMEALLALKPDLVLLWNWKDGGNGLRMAERLHKSGIAAVFVDLERLETCPDAFVFLGDLVGRAERGRTLANYARATLAKISAVTSTIPERERRTVYYAEGADGLATERETSVHAELIKLAGGKNVHRGEALDTMGMEKISLEQLLLYNPQVIVAQERAFFDAVTHDKRWQGIRGVKEKQLLLIPRKPFNWFDRPPSFMRLLGLKWFTNRLYPQRYPIDIVRETKEFYRLFLGVELSNKDVQEILR